MRPLLLCVTVLSLACGRPDTPESGAGSGHEAGATADPSSALVAAVLPLTPGLGSQPYVPDGLPAGLAVRASLFASPGSAPRGLGDPALVVEISKDANGKPWLRMVEGPEGCCPDFSRATPHDVTIRSGSGAAQPLVGQVYPPLGSSDGPTLRWRAPASRGVATEIVLASTTFGPYADEKALVDLARVMRAIPWANASGAVRLYVSTHISHSPTGHRVYIGARSTPLPEDARLLDASGATVATATFTAAQPYGCLAEAAGVAAFAVPHDVVDAFSRNTATGYRAEVLVGGQWRPVQLITSGCGSIE